MKKENKEIQKKMEKLNKKFKEIDKAFINSLMGLWDN